MISSTDISEVEDAPGNDMLSELSVLVSDCGYTLYDFEPPAGKNRIFKVEIDSPSGITHEACEKVSRRVELFLDTNYPNLEDYTLEVSSPGINRRLRRREHFESAITQNVKINRYAGGQLIGTLKSVGEEGVTVTDSKSSEVTVPWKVISGAFIDFKF